MSEALDVVDDFIYHAHMQERFKTAQANKIKRYIRQVNKVIAEYLKQKKTVETKKDYARVSSWIKDQCATFSRQILNIIEKDISRQFRTEQEWLKGTMPDMENYPDETRIVNQALFNAFNDMDTIPSYLTGLGEKIYRIWDSQLRIAYTTGVGTAWLIEQVMGKDQIT